MVKFFSSEYSYDYGFSAVTLAYFLRYPNPYSRHVASTDTISRSYDPETQRLTTVRLHVKRSRIPPAVLKIVGSAALGANEDGSTRSYILEKSVVDVKQGWMETESRNLDWNNVLSVIEKHTYKRPAQLETSSATLSTVEPFDESSTSVAVSVTLKSRIGEQIRKQRQRWGQQTAAPSDEDAPAKQSWLGSWTSSAMRSAIETIGLQRTEKSQPKAQKGMSVVLARLRDGGWKGVLEGMQADRELAI